jgi:citrate lyase synthetase
MFPVSLTIFLSILASALAITHNFITAKMMFPP